jgi:NAD(P)-dependent dehydrogenase (short-subunit alcohol dehydrogenase family)
MDKDPGEAIVHGADFAEHVHRNQRSRRQVGNSYEKSFEIRLDEVDFNGHLHNTNDIAEVVAFLAGPARWVNGQILYANGGVI